MSSLTRQPLASTTTWQALGTYVHLSVAEPDLGEAAAALAADVLDEVDVTCSRFRPDSDLLRVGAHPGEWVDIPAVLHGALRVALDAAETTGGLVTPTLGGVLVAAGYDRTYEEIRGREDGTGASPVDLPAPVDPQSWRRVELERGRVRVSGDLRLDLGATGKAYAADLVALSIVETLGVAVVVSVGGDVRAASPTSYDDGWLVEAAPTRADLDSEEGPACRFRLYDGGAATSSTRARRWQHGGRSWHHVIDPRTGRSSVPTWRGVTAVGHTCVAANVATTMAVVLGHDAPAWLDEHGVAALLVADDGTLHRTRAWVDDIEEIA